MKTHHSPTVWTTILLFLTLWLHLASPAAQRKLFEDDESAARSKPGGVATSEGRGASPRRSALFEDEETDQPIRAMPQQPGAGAQTTYRVREETIGEIEAWPFLKAVWSQDELHIAYKVTAGEKRWFIAFDGRLGPEFEDVSDPEISDDGAHVAYRAAKEGKHFIVVDHKPGAPFDYVSYLALTRDAAHVAYAANQAGKSFVVVDGRPGPQFDAVGNVEMSRDGAHLAYVAQQGGKSFVVLDGKRGPAYAKVSEVVMTTDGARVAYSATQEGGADLVVLDGKPGPAWDAVSDLTFSPGGKRFVYQAKRGDKWVMVIDGEAGPGFDQLDLLTLTFSPDGRRVAYVGDNNVGTEKHTGVAVVDGRPGPVYGSVRGLQFSPDSKRVAYEAEKNEKEFVVADGQPGPEFDFVSRVTFTPDSAHLLYTAKPVGKERVLSGEWVLLRDGKLLSKAEFASELAFSPDGKRFTHARWEGGKIVLIVDGQPFKTEYWELSDLVFSADGKHLAYTGVGPRRAWKCVVVDGQPGPRYAELRLGDSAFRPDGTVEYLANRDRELLRVRHIPATQATPTPARTRTGTRASPLFEDEETPPKTRARPTGLFEEEVPPTGTPPEKAAPPETRPRRTSLFEEDIPPAKTEREKTAPPETRTRRTGPFEEEVPPTRTPPEKAAPPETRPRRTGLFEEEVPPAKTELEKTALPEKETRRSPLFEEEPTTTQEKAPDLSGVNVPKNDDAAKLAQEILAKVSQSYYSLEQTDADGFSATFAIECDGKAAGTVGVGWSRRTKKASVQRGWRRSEADVQPLANREVVVELASAILTPVLLSAPDLGLLAAAKGKDAVAQAVNEGKAEVMKLSFRGQILPVLVCGPLQGGPRPGPGVYAMKAGDRFVIDASEQSSKDYPGLKTDLVSVSADLRDLRRIVSLDNRTGVDTTYRGEESGGKLFVRSFTTTIQKPELTVPTSEQTLAYAAKDGKMFPQTVSAKVTCEGEALWTTSATLRSVRFVKGRAP